MARTASRLPPVAGAAAATVCAALGFFALRANPCGATSSKHKSDSLSREHLNRENFNRDGFNRDLGFMDYVVFLLAFGG